MAVPVQPFTHDFETLSMFEKLSLTPPTFPSEVETALKAIAEKRAYFDALPPKAKAASKPAAAAGAGAGAGSSSPKTYVIPSVAAGAVSHE